MRYSALLSAVTSLYISMDAVDSFQPHSPHKPLFQQPASKTTSMAAKTNAWTAGLMLAAVTFFGPALPASADSTAAQIQLTSLPPSSISVQIQDLPVIGSLLSGTYTKVSDGALSKSSGKTSSILIKSPTDKVKAVQSLVTSGHLEFDVSGLVSSHIDIDVAADTAGVLTARVATPLVPKLPFRNLASASATSPTGGKESAWNMVTNMGSGETYYYNEKTGATQYMKPDKL